MNAHHKYREDWKFNYQCTIKTWKFNYQYTIKPPKVTVLRNGKCFNDGEKWEYKGNNVKVVNQFNWSFIYAETQGNKPLSRVYSKNEWVIKSMLCYGAEIWGFHKGFEVEKVHINVCKRILDAVVLRKWRTIT